MPLVFVHGVNTRDTDEDYVRSVAARKTMFEQIVVPVVVNRGFANFAVAEDIYWGDLGVTFGWNLRAVPQTSVLESLGPADAAVANLDLMEVISESATSSGAVEKLGADQPLAAAAKKAPAALVRAMFAPEAEQFAPRDDQPPKAPLSSQEQQKVSAQGVHLALMLMAVDDLAQALGENPGLIQGATDSEVASKIQAEVQQRYQARAQKILDAEAAAKTEHLGKFGDAIGWAASHLKSTIDAAKKAVGTAVAETGRGASLVALKQFRDGVSRRGLRFLGDVFVYLHHGRTATPSIYERVKKGLLALNSPAVNDGKREPFVLVTHSFGSEIVYDLLTTGALDDLTIDLWVTAGAQTSLFAEMQLFSGMKLPLPADTSKYSLGRPANVHKWVNFYDAADVLSYLHAPVFGDAAVKDIPVRAQANLSNAHGHYFADPEFYRQIAQEI